MLSLVLLAAALGFALAQDPYCGRECANNNGCNHPTPANISNPCSRCDGAPNGKCAPGHDCHQTCAVDSDCNQAGDCRMCLNGMCSSIGLCGTYCDSSMSCKGSCSVCEANKCVAPCNGPCTTPTVVPPPNGTKPENLCCNECGLCLQNGKCGADYCCTSSYCLSNCTSDKQCGQECPLCAPTLGKCTKLGCGSSCALNSDCDHTGGECKLCFGGYCTSNCGGHCDTAADCGADCNVCASGRCAPGTCGATCLTNAGCSDKGGCNFCKGGKCTIGQGCGGECSSDRDCDQGGACTICPLEPGMKIGHCKAP